MMKLPLVLWLALGVDQQLVPCGAGLCVGTTPKDVTLGVTVMETRGPIPDGGRAILQPVLPGAALVLQGVQPSGDGGSAVTPDVIIGSRNTHTGAGSFVSFRNGANGAELFGVSPSGASGTFSTGTFSTVNATNGNFNFVDAGTLYVTGATHAIGKVTTDGDFNLGGGCFTNTGGAMVLGCSVTGATNSNISMGSGGQVTLGTGSSKYNVVTLTDAVAAVTVTGSTGCTSPSVTWSNGTATFQLDVGTSCTGVSTIGVTFPAAANGWECSCTNTSATATRNIDQSAGDTTTVVLTNYSRTLGTAADFADGADVRCMCRGG